MGAASNKRLLQIHFSFLGVTTSSFEQKSIRSARGVMVVLVAMSLIGAGCATTSSEAAKPHKPQMITGEEEREALKLPDSAAGVLSFLGWLAAGCPPTSW
jgi:hypothetical protein